MAPRTSAKQNSSAGNAWKAGLRFREPKRRQFGRHANTQLFLIAPGNGDRVRGFRGRIKMRLGVKLKPCKSSPWWAPAPITPFSTNNFPVDQQPPHFSRPSRADRIRARRINAFRARNQSRDRASTTGRGPTKRPSYPSASSANNRQLPLPQPLEGTEGPRNDFN